ncbi:hypothetical protein P175DRAFT_0555706 [Aspergillus ochraceoroseus IBT 24754]|uniref:Uncharacterized protein n=1 Tax=Aspergillus ochraceoroseus IBT 24754 TaxID=1392256 RepID=A0A2T5M3C9_9EURO|nr:uncharacterized protein P175DRAFT_0555706 [Aspergillus ochraceoroseus IBT 24754]PTU23045.1 hypothetical protein P175DRAFT_0555706 [Aspergillus ochraceoroseus IBT 24754]
MAPGSSPVLAGGTVTSAEAGSAASRSNPRTSIQVLCQTSRAIRLVDDGSGNPTRQCCVQYPYSTAFSSAFSWRGTQSVSTTARSSSIGSHCLVWTKESQSPSSKQAGMKAITLMSQQQASELAFDKLVDWQYETTEQEEYCRLATWIPCRESIQGRVRRAQLTRIGQTFYDPWYREKNNVGGFEDGYKVSAEGEYQNSVCQQRGHCFSRLLLELSEVGNPKTGQVLNLDEAIILFLPSGRFCRSQGRVHIKSGDALTYDLINPNYFMAGPRAIACCCAHLASTFNDLDQATDEEWSA